MKYYIPISNLNLDTILSSESISPIGFYRECHFEGIQYYKAFNTLILFSDIPLFTVEDKEKEQYPIVLEIEDDNQFKKLNLQLIKQGDNYDVFSCPEPIQLSPWNCNIVYFSERGARSTRLLLSTSRHAKIGDKFIWKLEENGTPLNLMVQTIEDYDIEPQENTAVNIDLPKGAIWGYLLGEDCSLPVSASKILYLWNKIRNIVSNAVSNNGNCGENFYKELSKLHVDYCSLANEKALNAWADFCTDEDVNILNKFDIFEEARDKFFKKIGHNAPPDLPFNYSNKERWLFFRDQFEQYTDRYVNQSKSTTKYNTERIHLQFEEGMLLSKNFPLISLVLQFIYKGLISKESLRIDKETVVKNVLTEVSNFLRDHFMQNDWEDSSEKRYIRSFYNNITEFEPFDLNAIDNKELQSIVAFLFKGESFSDLLRYLQDNSISDYRLVFSLWGALEGYTSLPKDIIGPVINLENINFVNNLLFGWIANTAFPKQETLSFRRPFVPQSGQSDETSKVQSTEDVNNDLAQSLVEDLIKKCPGVKNQKDIYKEYFKKYGISHELIEELGRNPSLNKKGKGLPKNVQQWILAKEEIVTKKETIIQPTIFDKPNDVITKAFVDDPDVVDFIKKNLDGLLPKQKANIVQSYYSISEEYQAAGYYTKRGDSRSNADTISHFVRYCVFDKNYKSGIPNTFEVKKVLTELEKKLKERYGC